MSAAIDFLRARREQSLTELIEYLKIPSISTLGVGVEEAASHLAELMSGAGIHAQILPTEGIPLVYGEVKGPPDAPTMLIYGHYDVQPADISEGWSSEPFEPQVRDGRLYARGSGDNKGQHFAQIKAVEAYHETNTELPVNLKFLIEGEEEMGSPSLRKFIQANKELLKADIACSSDGSLHPSGRPTLSLGCRGLLYIELISHGVGKDLHSGTYGGPVPNPFWRLMEAVQCLRDDEGWIRVPGFYDSVLPVGDADQDALEGIPDPEAELRAVIGDGACRIPELSAFYAKSLTRPNLNICGFQGGYSNDGMKTILPGSARAKLDFRLVVEQDPERLFEDVCSFLKAEGFGDIEVRKLATFDASKTPADDPYVQNVIKAIGCDGVEPVIYPNFGGSVPDSMFTRDLGIPSVWFPLANADSNSHAPDENIDVEIFHRGCEIAATLMGGLA